MENHLQKGSFQNGGILHDLAGGCGARQNKNSGADDRANAERSQADPAEGFFQATLRLIRVREKLIDVLCAE